MAILQNSFIYFLIQLCFNSRYTLYIQQNCPQLVGDVWAGSRHSVLVCVAPLED